MKTKEEILNQTYMSAEDLKILIPTLGIRKCREYIKQFRQIMYDKKLCVPEGKTMVALTKIVRKQFGI